MQDVSYDQYSITVLTSGLPGTRQLNNGDLVRVRGSPVEASDEAGPLAVRLASDEDVLAVAACPSLVLQSFSARRLAQSGAISIGAFHA